MVRLVLFLLSMLLQYADSSYAVRESTFSVEVCKSRVDVCASTPANKGAATSYHICADGSPAVATAQFQGAGTDKGGWPLLRVSTGPAAQRWPDAVRLHAAGFAEGYLTQPWIAEMLQRMVLLRTPSARRAVRIFAAKQVSAINSALTKRARVPSAAAGASSQADLANDGPYASLVDLLLAQVEGVVAGYNAARSSGSSAGKDRPASLLDLLELNYDGDAFDIVQAADSGMAGGWLPTSRNGAGVGGGVAAGREPRRRGGDGSAATEPVPPGSKRFARFAELHAQLEEALEEHHAAGAAASAASASSAASGAAVEAGLLGTASAGGDSFAEELQNGPVPVAALGGRMPTSSRDLESWVRLSAAGRCTAAVVVKELANAAAASVAAGAKGSAAGAVDDASGLLAGATEQRGQTLRSLPAGPPGSRVSLWVAHTTWADYLELLRLWKVYDLHLDHEAVAAAHPAAASPSASGTSGRGSGGSSSVTTGGRFRASFSSYPGFVTSTDDWYQLSSGLLVTETTTSAVDARVLRHIHPSHGLPTWLRAGVANMVAKDGKAWADAFARHNGGTYNCMWLVVDGRRIWNALAAKPGSGIEDLPAASLLVVEQSPLRVLAVDGTPTLRATGLWVSANRPSLAAVRKDLGYPEELPPALPKRIAAALGGSSTPIASSAAAGQVAPLVSGGAGGAGGSVAPPLKHELAAAVGQGMSEDQRASLDAEAEADETVARLTAQVLVSATRHDALGLGLGDSEERFATAKAALSSKPAGHAAHLGSRSGAGQHGSAGSQQLSRFRALESALAEAEADAEAGADAEAQAVSDGLFEPSLLHFLSHAASHAADADVGSASVVEPDEAASVLMAPRSKGGEALLLNPLLSSPFSSSSRNTASSSSRVASASASAGGAARRRASAALARFREMGGSSADAVVRGAAAAAAGGSLAAAGLQGAGKAAASGSDAFAAAAASASAKDAMRFRQTTGISVNSVTSSSSGADTVPKQGKEGPAGSSSGSSVASSGSGSSGIGSSGGAGKPTAGAAYFSAFNNPRSRILQREAASVQSAGDMARMIRLNRWQGDPESQGRPYLAVAARFDLAPAADHARAANGAVDGKVASLGDILALETALTLGPSRDQQPPFDWLAYDGPGYCDSAAPAGSPRRCETMRAAAAAVGAGAGAAAATPSSASRGKPIADVRSLCTPDDGHHHDAVAKAAAGAAAAALCPVTLPCRWTWGWGHLAA